MTIDNKIRHIHNFRGLTQKELGLRIRLDAKIADNRFAQYGTYYRVSKMDRQISEALDVNAINFTGSTPGYAEDTMFTFFWMSEDNKGTVNLFQLVKKYGMTNASDDRAVRYNDNDDWPVHEPVGIYFDYGIVNNFMREWLKRKEELKAKEITNEDYMKWKLNRHSTCDGNKKPKNWRKTNDRKSTV